jgi:DDE superfamily endonuclease/Helix-turn-helix of DDE superfamily endonuclease
MISIEKTLLLDRRMRALTSLDGAAFVKLEKRFARVLAEELAARTRAGQPRQRAAGAGPKGVLPSVRAKLFFILFYLKAYPVQDVMGHLFGLSQPQVCARVAQLLPLLQTLMHAQLPARHGRDLAEVMAHLPEIKEVLIDGTERPIARPQHQSRRDRHYSGRRKRTTVKNVVVTAGGRVVLLTPTAPGRCHDKAEADRARVRLAAGMRLLGDSGFQGYAAGAAQVCTPRKKRRGRPLHYQHRRANRKLARGRVPVEHALASVKRLSILRQPLRAKRRTTADAVILIGCALHNYRLDQKALAA